MANVGNQKIKILYIMDMLLRETDEQHALSAQDIIEKLEQMEISAERKSIYRDIQILQEYGLDIVKADGQPGYYVASRDFELPELKLLVDAVAASKFITEKKSKELVNKIESLASVHEGKQLQRQVVVSDRVKTENERIYYAIDVIYNCIDNNHKMSFQYYEWNEKKEFVLRHDGERYIVSPEFLLWDNENYYLVAYEDKGQGIRHFRVDKIAGAMELEDAREGIEARKEIRKSDYTKKTFGMFSGEMKTVALELPKSLAGVVIDRFGAEVTMRSKEDKIYVRVDVEVSPQFFGWITGLGKDV